MREIHKTITLPLDGTDQTFRITKLDAFSGARVLRLLSGYTPEGGEIDLSAFFFSLSDADSRALMETCLSHVSAMLPAGPMELFDPVSKSWGLPALEHDAFSCLRLTLETLSWTLEGFFPDAGQTS